MITGERCQRHSQCLFTADPYGLLNLGADLWILLGTNMEYLGFHDMIWLICGRRRKASQMASFFVRQRKADLLAQFAP